MTFLLIAEVIGLILLFLWAGLSFWNIRRASRFCDGLIQVLDERCHEDIAAGRDWTWRVPGSRKAIDDAYEDLMWKFWEHPRERVDLSYLEEEAGL